jgi:hypothetical protein
MAIAASYSQAGTLAAGRTRPDAARSGTCLPIFAQHRRRPQDAGTGPMKASTAIPRTGTLLIAGHEEQSAELPGDHGKNDV